MNIDGYRDNLITLLKTGNALTTKRSEVILIGNNLASIGGLDLMQLMAETIRNEYPYGNPSKNGTSLGHDGQPAWHPQDLDFCGNGIAGWLP
jgi:hypothetical protein